MGTDKPDINRANIKENHHDQPVTISPDIEHKAVVTNVVNGIKTLTDIRKITPLGRFDHCIPRIQASIASGWSIPNSRRIALLMMTKQGGF